MRGLNLSFRIVRCLANQIGRKGLNRSNGSENNLQAHMTKKPTFKCSQSSRAFYNLKSSQSNRAFYNLNTYRPTAFMKTPHT
jgi:hypothetical protein